MKKFTAAKRCSVLGAASLGTVSAANPEPSPWIIIVKPVLNPQPSPWVNPPPVPWLTHG
jgi:hypothetical protein